MKLFVRFCGVAILVGLLHIASAEAISVSVNPTAQNVHLGNSTSVDILISGLGSEVVAAFDFDLTYDDAIITATGVNFGPYLGDGLPNSFQSFVLSPGMVDVAEVSLLSDADLDLLQPDSFALATILFDTLAVGESDLTLILGTTAPNDIKGRRNQVLQLDVFDGQITVSQTPEPGTIALFGTGLIGMLGYGWYRRKDEA